MIPATMPIRIQVDHVGDEPRDRVRVGQARRDLALRRDGLPSDGRTRGAGGRAAAGGAAGSTQPIGPGRGVGAPQPTGAAEIRPGCAGGAGLTVVGSAGDAGGVGSGGVAGGAGWSGGSSLMRASYATGRAGMGAPGRFEGPAGAAHAGPISPVVPMTFGSLDDARRRRRRSRHARSRLLQPVRHRLRARRRLLHEVLQPPVGRGHPSADRARRDGLAGHDGHAPVFAVAYVALMGHGRI